MQPNNIYGLLSDPAWLTAAGLFLTSAAGCVALLHKPKKSADRLASSQPILKPLTDAEIRQAVSLERIADSLDLAQRDLARLVERVGK